MESMTTLEVYEEIQSLINNIFDLIPSNNTMSKKWKAHAIKQSIALGDKCIDCLKDVYNKALQKEVLVIPPSISMVLEKEFEIDFNAKKIKKWKQK